MIYRVIENLLLSATLFGSGFVSGLLLLQEIAIENAWQLITGTGGALACLIFAIRYLVKFNEKKDARIEELQEAAIAHRDKLLAEKEKEIQELRDMLSG